MKQYTYRIEGEPLHSTDGTKGSSADNPSYKHRKMNWIVSFENQHEENPKLETPVSVEVQFFQKDTFSHISLSRLIRFVEKICIGYAYTNLLSITSFSATRHRTDEFPYTLILITEEKKNDKRKKD
jgi:hypothetical protein